MRVTANQAVYRYTDAEVMSASVVDIPDIKSNRKCATSCLATPLCMGYSFESTTQQCKLHLTFTQLRSSAARSNVTANLVVAVIESTPYSDLAVGKTHISRLKNLINFVMKSIGAYQPQSAHPKTEKVNLITFYREKRNSI